MCVWQKSYGYMVAGEIAQLWFDRNLLLMMMMMMMMVMMMMMMLQQVWVSAVDLNWVSLRGSYSQILSWWCLMIILMMMMMMPHDDTRDADDIDYSSTIDNMYNRGENIITNYDT